MMEDFTEFYKNPTVEALKLLLETKKIKPHNLYDFLVGYTEYLDRQVKIDSF
jgi:hypothetical protein